MSDAMVVWDAGKYEFQRKLGNFVQYFQVNLPTNSLGVPLKLIHPVPLAESILDCETTDDVPEEVLSRAVIDIELEEGLPLVDGVPVWERLDGELYDYYQLFKQYREMYYLEGTRALARVAAANKTEGRYLSALAKVYHWQLRCKAYDVHKEMEARRKKQFMVEKLESKHMQTAERLLEQSMDFLESHPEQLNPKTALQMVQLAVKVGRLSVGLNGDKPGYADGSPNINITQTTLNSIPDGSSGDGSSGSAQKEETPDLDYLQSIVHILDKSGALDRAKEQEVIDAEFSEVND